MRGLLLVALLASCASGCGRIGFDGVSGPGGDDGGDPMPAFRQRLDLNRVNPSEPLLDFPLLVVLDDTRSDRSKFGADLASSTVFFTDSDGNHIPSEIEQFGGASEPFIAWVRVPRYDSSSTLIYVEYGGTPVASDPESVWTTGYEGVWHLAGDTDLPDSTANHRTGERFGATDAPGLIGSGVLLDGTSFVRISDSATGPLDRWTMSGWLDATSFGGSPTAYTSIITRQLTTSGEDDFYLGLEPGGHALAIYNTSSGEFQVNGPIASLNAWHHYASTWDGTTVILYFDGVQRDMQAPGGGGLERTDHPIFIGGGHNSLLDTPYEIADDDFALGSIDEVRLERTVRSPAWISTEFDNQSDRVLTYGPVEEL